MHVWYVDAGTEDSTEPGYTHCLVLSHNGGTWVSPRQSAGVVYLAAPGFLGRAGVAAAGDDVGVRRDDGVVVVAGLGSLEAGEARAAVGVVTVRV